jgi:hypothetical protein
VLGFQFLLDFSSNQGDGGTVSILVMNESNNGNHGEPCASPHTLHPTISSNFCYLRKVHGWYFIFFHGDYWVVHVLVAE